MRTLPGCEGPDHTNKVKMIGIRSAVRVYCIDSTNTEAEVRAINRGEEFFYTMIPSLFGYRDGFKGFAAADLVQL
jgi:hypothetical protein